MDDKAPNPLSTTVQPRWLSRRLRRLDEQFSEAAGELVWAHYRVRSRRQGRALARDDLERIAQAWLRAGPQVPAPPLRMVPSVLEHLALYSAEEPLLEDWLVQLSADHVRKFGWRCGALSALGEGLRDGSVRRYWLWLLGMVQEQTKCSRYPPERALAAAVITRLYAQLGAEGLMRRVARWKAIRIPDSLIKSSCVLAEYAGRASPLLSGDWVQMKRVRVRHLATPDDFRHEGEVMANCLAECHRQATGLRGLFFVVSGPRAERSTLRVEVDESGRWFVAELRGPFNGPAPSYHRSGGDEVCRELQGYSTDRLVREHVSSAKAQADRWAQHANHCARLELLPRLVPGIGANPPQQVLGAIYRGIANADH